ncbi:MAG: TonB-dependent receptor, partial [Burkholderiaceae bacterium]|nr:TonB-dependent receptor [Burkholderiaceae bacterium]
FAAIDRIEILRDGASAVYGTDAIGGVINFILRRDFKGFEISAETQQPRASGGGDTHRLSMTGGYGSIIEQGFNVMASIDLRKQKALAARDRAFSATGILQGDVDGGTSGTSFPGDLNGVEPTLPNCNPPSSVPNSNATSCRYDVAPEVDLIPQTEQLTGLMRGSLAITPDHTAAVEYLRARNETTSRIAPEPTGHLIPATSPFFPAGAIGEAEQVPDIIADNGSTVLGGVANWREVPAGQRVGGNVTTTERAMFELQGFLSGWDYRTALGRSKSTSDQSVKQGYVNKDLMQRGVWNGVINPFGDQTAAGAAAISAAQVRELVQTGENKVDFVDLRITKDLLPMPGGVLALAVGVEHRKEKSRFDVLPVAAVLPSLGISTESNTRGKRNVSAIFTELSIPVTRALEVTAAARLDKYSDFGSTLNPKLAFRLQQTKQLVIRGSVNKGFRAPTLYEIYRPLSLVNTTDFYDDPNLCPGGDAVPGAPAGAVCNQQVFLRLGGPGGVGLPISTLKPEKSRAATLGLVFEPTRSLTLGIDYWHIGVNNQISSVSEQAIFGDTAKYGGKFVRCGQLNAGPGPGIDRSDIPVCLNYPAFDPIAYVDSPIENLGKLKTRGIDLSALWRSGPTAYGNWAASIDGTYVTQYKYQREFNGEYISALGRYSDNAPIFRWQHALAIHWQRDAWGATLAQRYKSGYVDQDPSRRVSSYSLFDASISWVGLKNLTVAVGVNNLFDKKPPLSLQATTFQQGYDSRFTDPTGRTIVLRAAYKF